MTSIFVVSPSNGGQRVLDFAVVKFVPCVVVHRHVPESSEQPHVSSGSGSVAAQHCRRGARASMPVPVNWTRPSRSLFTQLQGEGLPFAPALAMIPDRQHCASWQETSLWPK